MEIIPRVFVVLVVGDGAAHGERDLGVGDEDHPLLSHLGLVVRLDVDHLPHAGVTVL